MLLYRYRFLNLKGFHSIPIIDENKIAALERFWDTDSILGHWFDVLEDNYVKTNLS